MSVYKKIAIAVLILIATTIGGVGLLCRNIERNTVPVESNTIEQNNYEEPDLTVVMSEEQDAELEMAENSEMSSESELSEETEALNQQSGTEEDYGEQNLLDMEDYSRVPADNGCPYYIKVNRERNVITIYALDEKGYYTKPIKAMVCSVGKDNGTPVGTYAMKDKHSWCSLVGGVYGQYAYRVTGQIMFHSVPYYSMNKGDLEIEEYNKLGENASLGCIRLSVSDAKWIYDNCPQGTLVTIYDSKFAGPLGTPVAEELDVEDERSGWDPTDPDEENPWRTGKPRILGAGDRTIDRGCTYDLTAGVLVLDDNGNDITDRLTVEGTVDALTVGEYPVTYQVQDEAGNTCTVHSVIRVVDPTGN